MHVLLIGFILMYHDLQILQYLVCLRLFVFTLHLLNHCGHVYANALYKCILSTKLTNLLTYLRTSQCMVINVVIHIELAYAKFETQELLKVIV